MRTSKPLTGLSSRWIINDKDLQISDRSTYSIHWYVSGTKTSRIRTIHVYRLWQMYNAWVMSTELLTVRGCNICLTFHSVAQCLAVWVHGSIPVSATSKSVCLELIVVMAFVFKVLLYYICRKSEVFWNTWSTIGPAWYQCQSMSAM
jgi:hypothetical protein